MIGENQWLDKIMPKKEPVQIVKWSVGQVYFNNIGNHLAPVICCVCGSRDHIELVVVKGELLFFKQRDGPYLPTLKLLHKCECNSMSDVYMTMTMS